MRPNKNKTAVHGCHCPRDRAVRMCTVLAIPRVGFECATCFIVCYRKKNAHPPQKYNGPSLSSLLMDSQNSLDPRPIHAIRVSGGGFKPSVIANFPAELVEWRHIWLRADDDWERRCYQNTFRKLTSIKHVVAFSPKVCPNFDHNNIQCKFVYE